MSGDDALAMMSELLRMGLVLSLPLLGVILLTGVLTGVLQVVTQVQDASIAFVPKIIVFAIVLAWLAPWMLEQLTAFALAMFARLAQ
ncbi:flagellar biosynthetic protein FliQ [Povalibacter uvarum]|uniref:Flagellar biosynthetic protein FliQ n=1 Tax=Povalibacter uvarum TaxID=732238 RepID=A0A841HFD9_9GAMM|nr:flagellar biosynthetic protein FliQ [Povalibacter uvarum]MBB6091159.1 flagellar biosynthetic protein FliQ [Povalibacter uvarum]